MEKDIAVGKPTFGNHSKFLMDYLPDEHWQKIWNAKLDHWECKDVYLIDSELGTFPQ